MSGALPSVFARMVGEHGPILKHVVQAGINCAQVEVKALAARVLGSYALQPIEGQAPVHAGHWTAVLPCGKWLRVKAQT
jgi:hypothetical protein